MQIVLYVLLGWVLLSVPVGLLAACLCRASSRADREPASAPTPPRAYAFVPSRRASSAGARRLSRV